MPIAMVFTLMPALLVVASLLGTLDGGGATAFAVTAAVTLLAGAVIGLFRFMRTLEEDVAGSAPGEHIHDMPAQDGDRLTDTDHDLPMAA